MKENDINRFFKFYPIKSTAYSIKSISPKFKRRKEKQEKMNTLSLSSFLSMSHDAKDPLLTGGRMTMPLMHKETKISIT